MNERASSDKGDDLIVASADSPDTAELLRVISPALLGYFRRRVALAEDAADLLSEMLLIIWRKEHKLPRGATEARMYCFGIARKVLLGHRRSTRRRTALTQRLADELSLNTPKRAQPPEPDEFEAVRAAIQLLPAQDQEIVRLVYWDGFTQSEAATLLRMNESSLRTRLSRAKITLQKTLNLDS